MCEGCVCVCVREERERVVDGLLRGHRRVCDVGHAAAAASGGGRSAMRRAEKSQIEREGFGRVRRRARARGAIFVSCFVSSLALFLCDSNISRD